MRTQAQTQRCVYREIPCQAWAYGQLEEKELLPSENRVLKRPEWLGISDISKVFIDTSQLGNCFSKVSVGCSYHHQGISWHLTFPDDGSCMLLKRWKNSFPIGQCLRKPSKQSLVNLLKKHTQLLTRDCPWSCCLIHGHSQVLPERRMCCFQ